MTQSVAILSLSKHYLLAVLRHWLLLAGTTAAFTIAAAGYAVTKPAQWRASQALVVRDETGGNSNKLGRFDSIDWMKASQETILEVVRGRSVVEAALRRVGPNTVAANGGKWPSNDDLEAFQSAISISAPKGAEFGRTEMIYLSVKSSSRERALASTLAVCEFLELELGKLRDRRATSLIQELEATLQLAQTELAEATARLAVMEKEVGGDLGELRLLNEIGSGDSNLRTALNQLKVEIRQATSRLETQQQLREILREIKRDPAAVLATPASLLEAQPALKRMKDGLVDAQIQCATLRGKMSPNHPAVRAAEQAEAEVRQNLRGEVGNVLQTLEAEVSVAERLLQTLVTQNEDLQQRLNHVASLRATYSNLAQEVKQRATIVEKATKDLTDARASQFSAQSTSLITRFNDPVIGEHPIGPGKITIVAAGMGGGFATGLGLIVLISPLAAPRARRWSDYLGLRRRSSDRNAQAAPASRRRDDNAPRGRRADDLLAGRRADDQPLNPRLTNDQVAGRVECTISCRPAEPPPPRPLANGATEAPPAPTPPAATAAPPASPPELSFGRRLRENLGRSPLD